MTPEEVKKFRDDNNNIVISNFDPESSAPLMNPIPKFKHAFESFPEVMATIAKQVWSLSRFELSRQLLANDMDQVSSVSLLMTASTTKGFLS